MTWECLCSQRPQKLWGAEDTQAVGVQSPPIGREEVVLERGLRVESTMRGQREGLAAWLVGGREEWRVPRSDLQSGGRS